jgi:hypothetical protein
MSSTQTLSLAGSLPWLRRLARTTPGVIGAIAIGVAVFCMIVGAVCAAQLDHRIAAHTAILDRSEPFAYAAQNLYAALSAADAAAASAYLSGIETPAMRERYQRALADAASALTDVTVGARDPSTRKALADITVQLAAYTGLVESARANNRQGFVVGSGYLREASSLMQNTMLPGAARIYAADLKTVADDQRAISSPPVGSCVMLGLLLLAIGIGSVILCGRTNRQFNLGLVVAAVIVAATAGWVLLATGRAAGLIDQSRTKAAVFEQLTNARTLARQARTEETLQLIAHGDIAASEKSFNDRIHDLSLLLADGPAAATDSLNRWTASHRQQVSAYQNSDYNAAVSQAIGPAPQASTAQFGNLESSLRDEIEDSRATLRGEVSTAGAWLTWAPIGTFVLMAAAAAAVVGGLWPRLKEFL